MLHQQQWHHLSSKSSHCSVQENDVISCSNCHRKFAPARQTQTHGHLLGRQRVDVPDLPGHGHGVAVDHVEVLLSKQQQTLAGVQTLDPGTAVHVLDLKQSAEQSVYIPNLSYEQQGIRFMIKKNKYMGCTRIHITKKRAESNFNMTNNSFSRHLLKKTKLNYKNKPQGHMT